MSVQYCLHIFDSDEAPLTMEDLYIDSKMIFWPPEREMFEEYYSIPDLMDNEELVARGRALVAANEIEFNRLQEEYLRRWLTPDGKYPGTEWRDMLTDGRPWKAWELSWYRVSGTPNFDFGDDYWKPAVTLMGFLGPGLITLDDEAINSILSIVGDPSNWDNDKDKEIKASAFLDKYRGHKAFMIAH